MRSFQFSLWSLLVATALVAVFCVAILNAGTFWTAIMLWLTLLGIPFGVLAAVYRRDSQRAFWLGYVFGGGLYACLTVYAISGINQESWIRPALADHALISGQAASWVYTVLPESRRPPLITEFRGVSYAAQLPRAFRYQFHFAFIVLSGWLCGLAGMWLYRTQRKSTQTSG